MPKVAHSAGASDHIENRLRSRRTAKALSQATLAGMAGVTRQAISAIEANQYLPTTAVALRLANALNARVEDLFRLEPTEDSIHGELVGPRAGYQRDAAPLRVKVARIGKRVILRPVATLGDVLNFTSPADGLIMPKSRAVAGRAPSARQKVEVRLLRDRQTVEKEIVVAGCDPSIFLLGEYVRRREDRVSVVGWSMGSTAAIETLKRGEVHAAGIHIVDQRSGEANVPYLRRHLRGRAMTVVTFATWEEGFMVRPGHPKGIRAVADLARKDVTLVNREPGAGARLLLDHELAKAGMPHRRIRGYNRIASSHLEVARMIAEGQADVGVGVGSAARLLGLHFLPIQQERYDLVLPTAYLDLHPHLSVLLDVLVSRAFRTEVDALGGYDTRETGNIVDWN